MNKLKFTIFAMVLTFFAMYSSSDLYANVFAHNIRITQPTSTYPFDGTFSDGSGAGIRFTLSDYADTVNINIYDGTMTHVRSILVLDLGMGENIVEWDGMDDGGTMVADGNYKVEIYTANAGYDQYTVLYDKEVSIYTRGVTSMKSQAAKNFGFTYSASGGGYAFGVTRHTNDMEAYGDAPGTASLSVTYSDSISTVGSDNLRYSSEASEDGYVYLARRSSSVPAVYRYHVDSLVVELVDSGGYGGAAPQGIALGGADEDQLIIVSDWNGKVHTFLNDGLTQSHEKTTILDDSTALFWDVTTGADSGWLYVTYQSPDTAFLPGVAAFDFTAWAGTPLTLADAAWVVEAPDTATAGTITYSHVDDQLYLTFARRPHAPNVQGIYTVKDLTGTPTLELAYLDPEDNMTQYRADVAIDAAGNIVFFENSNEFITLISPPHGPNSYSYMDDFTTIEVAPTESIASVKIDENGDLVPDNIGNTVTIQGIVTSPDYQGSRLEIYVQDETGGIQLTSSNDSGMVYEVGSLVTATGTIGQYRGMTQLDVGDVTANVVVKGVTTPPDPMVVTVKDWLDNAEMYEGSLIQINGIAKADETTWPDGDGFGNFTYTDGKLEFIFRIDSDTEVDEMAEPADPINSIGISGQFTYDEPANNGYQLMPRFVSDIDTAVAALPNSNFALLSPEDGAKVVITDSSSTFTATWESSVDLNGDEILYQWYVIGGALQSGALSDTSHTFTALELFGVLGAEFDSATVQWTVQCKGAETDFVGSIDTFSVTFINGLVVGVDQTVPAKFFVDQNYPNPFNPTTTIKFGLPNETTVDLVIYDILGREVISLVRNKSLKAGTHTYELNASNLASGTYIYRLTTDKNVVTKKMLLLK